MGSYTDGLRLMVILFLSLFFALPYSLEEASLLQTPLPRIDPSLVSNRCISAHVLSTGHLPESKWGGPFGEQHHPNAGGVRRVAPCDPFRRQLSSRFGSGRSG